MRILVTSVQSLRSLQDLYTHAPRSFFSEYQGFPAILMSIVGEEAKSLLIERSIVRF